MRTLCYLWLALGLALAASPKTRADDAVTARAVVERAVEAHGGIERLARTRLMTRTATGVILLAGKEIPFSADETVELPDRCRLSLELNDDGRKVQTVAVLNGDKGWQAAGGMTLDIDKPRLDELKLETYLFWVTTLYPLIKEDGFTFAAAPAAKVDDRPASAVKVSRQGRPDVTLYFDKESGLLVKTEHRTRIAGFEATKEYVYRDHKRVEGLRLPSKSVQLAGGRKQAEVSAYSYKFPTRVDDNTFAKP